MRARRTLFTALLVVLPLSSVVNAPSGTAATCAEGRLYVDGTQVGPKACGATDPADICFSHDGTVSNAQLGLDSTGAGASICVHSPVVAR